MKKSISFILLVCLLIICVLPVNAETHPYSFDEAIVVTEDSFSQLFNTDHIDQVTYDYQFDTLQENDFQAHVILEISLKIYNVIYSIVTKGTVDSYQLNNGDILWEGPLDGEILINGKPYSVIAGFNLLDSTQESMISLTLQNDSTLVAISFGTNIITGSVLDFFMSQSNNESSNTNTVTVKTQFDNFTPEDSYSTNVIEDGFGPGFSQITHPGDGGGSLNLGPNGEFIHQSTELEKHANGPYTSIKSGVYFDNTRNILLVTLSTFANQTNEYYISPAWDITNVNIDEFDVELILEDQPASSYAYIEFLKLPQEILQTTNNSSGVVDLIFAVFQDSLSLINIPTSTIALLCNDFCTTSKGKIITTYDGMSAGVRIERAALSNYNDLDNLPYGLPFAFQLDKGNDNAYIGNTPYIVNTHIKYRVYQYSLPLLNTQPPTFIVTYVDVYTTHEGSITLQ